MNHRDTLDELRSRIAEGRYEVDPVSVADAVIRHHSSFTAAKRAGFRHLDAPRRRRLAAVRRLGHRRSRRATQPLAA